MIAFRRSVTGFDYWYCSTFKLEPEHVANPRELFYDEKRGKYYNNYNHNN